jgi:hypothetical protein
LKQNVRFFSETTHFRFPIFLCLCLTLGLQLHPLRPRVLLTAGADGFARFTDFVTGREVQPPLACQARVQMRPTAANISNRRAFSGRALDLFLLFIKKYFEIAVSPSIFSMFDSSVRRPQYVALDAAFASDGAFFVTACDHGGIYYHSTSVPNAFQRALGGDREPRDSDFSGTCGQMQGNHGTIQNEYFQSCMHSRRKIRTKFWASIRNIFNHV